ncbi:MAG: DUF4255 domain-containing protein [Pseudomonadota bacterium]
MIDQALNLVRDKLDSNLRARFGVSDKLVALTPLVDEAGKPAAEARDRLTLFVINIAQDGIPRARPRGGSRQVTQHDPVHLDIYVMLAAGHDADLYSEALKLISAGMLFFQSHPIFTPQNTPDMPPGLNHLSLEISNMKSEELGQIWGNLGGRYVPSVLYKMRSVVLDANTVQRVEPLIQRPRETILPEGGE